MQKSFYPQAFTKPGGSSSSSSGNQQRGAITLRDLLQQPQQNATGDGGGEKEERFYNNKKITQCVQCGDDHTSERRRCWKCYKRNARTKHRADQYGLAQVVLEAVRERMLKQLPPPQKRQEGEDPADPAIERERRRKFLDTPLGSLCRHISRVLEREDDMWFYDFVKSKQNIKPTRIRDVPASLLINNIALLHRVQKTTCNNDKSTDALIEETVENVGGKRKRAPQEPSLTPKSKKRQKTTENDDDGDGEGESENNVVVEKKKEKEKEKEKTQKRPRGRPKKARALDPLPPSPSLSSLLAASPALNDEDDSDSEEQDFQYASGSDSSFWSDDSDDDCYYYNSDSGDDGGCGGCGRSEKEDVVVVEEEEASGILPASSPDAKKKKKKKKKQDTTKKKAVSVVTKKKKKTEKTPRVRKTKAKTFRPQKKFVDAYEEGAVVQSESRDCQLDPMELLQKLREQDGNDAQTPAHLREFARKQEQEEIRMEELYENVDLSRATGLDISELNSRAGPAPRKGRQSPF